MSPLTHINSSGEVTMIDVGEKGQTNRHAVARCEVHASQATIDLIINGNLKKGDIFATARIAGIMAAKKTSELIPLCHPIPISNAQVSISIHPEKSVILVESSIRCRGQTGVEMEALTAVSIAALTIYDMAKAVQRDMRIEAIRLVKKQGGRSGTFVAEE